MKHFATKLLLTFVIVISLTVQAEEVDIITGLNKGEEWEIVRNNCTACHSAKLIIQNHGTRNHWAAMIEWMQATQGLWQFDTQTHEKILTYLSANYGPKENARRASLDPRLMPKNPYKKTLSPQAVTLNKQ